MADPQTADQGFLAGLLGKFGADPAAAYGGLLSDPATQRQFALRSLGAAAQAMGQASMPVPYKGGTPWGSFLGSAGGAAATAGDELIKARLEQAQQQQALANVGLSQQQVTLMQAALPGLKSLIATGQDRLGAGGSGTGTGTDGKPLTGPAKIIAGQGGKVVSSTTADASLPPEARALLDTISGPESDGAYNVRWGGPHGDKTFSDFSQHPNISEPGPQGDSTAAGRYQIVNSTWKPLQAKYGFGDFSPATQDQAAWHLAADTYKEQTGRDLLTDLQAGKTDQVASALHGQWSTLDMGSYGKNLGKYQEGGGASPQTAAVPPPPPGYKPQDASGGAYSVPPPPGPPPKPGEYATPVRTGNVPLPPAAPAPAGPPMAQPAAPRGLLDTSQGPLGSSAAPPQLATPPAAGAPGPVTGLLGQQPTQQVAAADAPQLSPAAATVLQGINRQQAGGGLLASGSVAGGNAVPSGEPPAVAQAGPPHTGAAGAAELAGLLAQQPASAAPPTATPYTNAPPANGQGAPAPGPAPTGPPIAPPLNLPPIPSQMPAMPNLPAVQPTPQQQIAQGVAGLMALSGHPAPPWIDDLAKMPAQMAMEQYKAWVGGQANMMTEQYKKQIEVAAAGTISYLQSQGQLPADLTKMTNEQNLKLRNELAIRGMQINPTTGRPEFTPDWIEMQGKLKVAEAQANAGFQFVDVPVRDAKGNLGTVKMSGKDAAAYLGNANQSLIPQAPGGAAPGTAPAPGGSPAAPQPAVTPYFSPGQKAQEEAIGTALGEEYKEVGNEARTGFQAKPYLLSIQQAMQTFDNPGAGAQTKLDTLKAIQGTLNGVGVQLTPTLQDWIAKGEVMGKSGTQLGFELAKSLGPRESQMIVQQAIRNNPGIETSASGNRDLTALMGAIIDRNQDKLKFYNQYYQNNNNSFMGAQQAFNAWNPPEVMVSKIAPYLLVRPNGDKMSRAEYDKLPAGVTVKQPDGVTFTKPVGPQ